MSNLYKCNAASLIPQHSTSFKVTITFSFLFYQFRRQFLRGCDILQIEALRPLHTPNNQMRQGVSEPAPITPYLLALIPSILSVERAGGKAILRIALEIFNFDFLRPLVTHLLKLGYNWGISLNNAFQITFAGGRFNGSLISQDEDEGYDYYTSIRSANNKRHLCFGCNKWIQHHHIYSWPIWSGRWPCCGTGQHCPVTISRTLRCPHCASYLNETGHVRASATTGEPLLTRLAKNINLFEVLYTPYRHISPHFFSIREDNTIPVEIRLRPLEHLYQP